MRSMIVSRDTGSPDVHATDSSPPCRQATGHSPGPRSGSSQELQQRGLQDRPPCAPPAVHTDLLSQTEHLSSRQFPFQSKDITITDLPVALLHMVPCMLSTVEMTLELLQCFTLVIGKMHLQKMKALKTVLLEGVLFSWICAPCERAIEVAPHVVGHGEIFKGM